MLVTSNTNRNVKITICYYSRYNPLVTGKPYCDEREFLHPPVTAKKNQNLLFSIAFIEQPLRKIEQLKHVVAK